MNDSKVIAKRPYRPFDLATDKIWMSLDRVMGYKYVLFHFMNHENRFSCAYTACHTVADLNDVKSKILNCGFKIDWDNFNFAIGYLNEH